MIMVLVMIQVRNEHEACLTQVTSMCSALLPLNLHLMLSQVLLKVHREELLLTQPTGLLGPNAMLVCLVGLKAFVVVELSVAGGTHNGISRGVVKLQVSKKVVSDGEPNRTDRAFHHPTEVVNKVGMQRGLIRALLATQLALSRYLFMALIHMFLHCHFTTVCVLTHTTLHILSHSLTRTEACRVCLVLVHGDCLLQLGQVQLEGMSPMFLQVFIVQGLLLKVQITPGAAEVHHMFFSAAVLL